MRIFHFIAIVLLALAGSLSCETSSFNIPGNQGGTQPINQSEAKEYRKAITRCYRTGGTRVVKIEGNLRCF